MELALPSLLVSPPGRYRVAAIVDCDELHGVPKQCIRFVVQMEVLVARNYLGTS